MLLRAYPAAFRAAYGRDMEQCVRDQWHDHRRAAPPDAGADARFWAAAVWDVTRSAPALHLDAARARWRAGGRRARRDGPWDGPQLQPRGAR